MCLLMMRALFSRVIARVGMPAFLQFTLLRHLHAQASTAYVFLLMAPGPVAARHPVHHRVKVVLPRRTFIIKLLVQTAPLRHFMSASHSLYFA